MELSDYLRDPIYAAIIAAIVVGIYLNLKARLNKEPQLQTSEYVKPGLLVGLLVYFIVANGTGIKEKISSDPF